MAKLTKPRLPRGTKLTKDSVFTAALQAAGTELSGHFSSVNLKNADIPFRITWNIPVVDGWLYGQDNAAHTQEPYSIVFMAPPLQGETNALPITIKEVHLSFDQKDVSNAVEQSAYEDWTNQSMSGNLIPGAGLLDMTIAIKEKVPSLTNYKYERQILSVDIPSLTFEAGINPFVLTTSPVSLQRDRVYMLTLAWPGSYNFTGKLWRQLQSITISLVGSTALVPRDIWTNASHPEVMNAPKEFQNNISPTVAIGVPVSNGTIEAETSTGVMTAIDKIDTEVDSKLWAGMTRTGHTPQSGPGSTVGEHFDVSAAIEIIAVPMFQSVWPYHKIAATQDVAAPITHDLSRAPYADVAAAPDVIADRRIIRIDSPTVIHHVLVTRNAISPNRTVFQPLSKTAQWPTSITLTDKIGVALGAGIRSNWVGYQQVAYASITPANKATYTYDRSRTLSTEGILAADPIMCTSEWEHELLVIPIPNDGAHLGVAVKGTQGYPIYAGQSDSLSYSRTNVYDPVLGMWATPVNQGSESFIEVRWVIRDTSGLMFDGVDGPASEDEVYVGSCGAWVYLVCKTPLTVR